MEISVKVIKSEKFRQIYAVGAVGGHSPYDFRIAFYNDSPKSTIDGGKQVSFMERMVEEEVILSPLAAKELSEWLSNHVTEFEKQFGEIKKPGKNPEPEHASPIQGYM